MREILFRGKRKENDFYGKVGEWVYGIPIENKIGTFICFEKNPHYCYQDGYIEIDEFSKVVPETIGEYTGLTDKNNNKIFEGDIIRTKKYGKIIGHSTVNYYDIFKVIYEPAVFRLENKNRGFNLVGNGGDYEVIGNIHDNPELLKGDAEE